MLMLVAPQGHLSSENPATHFRTDSELMTQNPESEAKLLTNKTGFFTNSLPLKLIFCVFLHQKVINETLITLI